MGSTPNNIKPSQTLTDRVRRIVISRGLLSRGDVVVVGVSGGPDSVALLNLLCAFRYELGITIVAAHFNHRLRPAAAADERFVKDLAKRFKVSVVGGRPQRVRPAKGSVEDWARRERLQFLTAVAKRQKASAVALAHTRDDLAETVLMRVLRGSGLLGLRGILAEREMKGVRFIRPLLDVSKDEILCYLKIKKLSYRTDETNLKTDFFRNKVRLKLLPLLADGYNPNIRQVLVNLADSASADYDFLNREALQVFARAAQVRQSSVRLNIKVIDAVHPALRRMVLRQAFERCKGDLKQFALEHMMEIEDLIANRPAGSIVDLPGGVKAVKSKTFLEIRCI